jgi:adenylate cyclase
MSEPLTLRISEGDRPCFEIVLAAPLEIGRQRDGEPPPYALLPPLPALPNRLVLVPNTVGNVSRSHLYLEPLADGRVRVTNRSQVDYKTPQQATLPPRGSVELQPPFSLNLGNRTLEILDAASADEFGVRGLDAPTIAPGGLSDLSRRLSPLPPLTGPHLDALVGWLQTTMAVVQSTVGSPDFLDRAATALVQIVGLQTGRVLLFAGDGWEVKARHGATSDEGWHPSRHVLDRVRRERRTFWQHAPVTGGDMPSMLGLASVIAAPILDAAGSVIGVLYGERRDGHPSVYDSGKVEALLVDLLAGGVATGLARQAEQLAAAKARVQFEEFFTPQLAEHLRRDKTLLDGRLAEVTLLFCDVRGFSLASEKLGPANTVRWLSDVLGELSECVLREEGVLVDYVGDELVAMWGAPTAQPDHAARGVRAALAMRATMGALNMRWEETLQVPTEVGLGLNTGLAQVGNMGTKHKFKYGPLGHTVNLASRVQGLTKYLRCRLLVTASTRQFLGPEYLVRRVVTARVVGIDGPVKLYEVDTLATGKTEYFEASEVALEALEAGEFALAARRAGSLLETHPYDGTLLLTLARATHQLMHPDLPFDPVWTAPGK